MEGPFLGQTEIRAQTRALASSSFKHFQDREVGPFYTIIGRLPSPLPERIFEISQSLEDLYRQYYYYPKNRYHMTVLGEMSTEETSSLDVVAAVQELGAILPVHGVVHGAELSPSSVFIPVYFPEDELHGVRTRLRARLGVGTDYSERVPMLDHIGWVNILRTTKAVDEKFLARVVSLGGVELGEIRHLDLEVWETTSMVLHPERSRRIYPVD